MILKYYKISLGSNHICFSNIDTFLNYWSAFQSCWDLSWYCSWLSVRCSNPSKCCPFLWMLCYVEGHINKSLFLYVNNIGRYVEYMYRCTSRCAMLKNWSRQMYNLSCWLHWEYSEYMTPPPPPKKKIIDLIYNFHIVLSIRYGSRGICFTYGTGFGIKGLVAAGWTFRTSSAIRKATDSMLLEAGEKATCPISMPGKIHYLYRTCSTRVFSC